MKKCFYCGKSLSYSNKRMLNKDEDNYHYKCMANYTKGLEELKRGAEDGL